MQRVQKKMISQGLDERYDDIFKEYLRESIIESVEVQPKNFHKFIWILNIDNKAGASVNNQN